MIDLKMKNLKKEIRKLTHNPKLNKFIKKLDKMTSFRKSSNKNMQFRADSHSGADHKVFLLDPDVMVS